MQDSVIVFNHELVELLAYFILELAVLLPFQERINDGFLLLYLKVLVFELIDIVNHLRNIRDAAVVITIAGGGGVPLQILAPLAFSLELLDLTPELLNALLYVLLVATVLNILELIDYGSVREKIGVAKAFKLVEDQVATSLNLFLYLVDHFKFLLLQFLVLVKQLLRQIKKLLLILNVTIAVGLVPCNVFLHLLAKLGLLRYLVVIVRGWILSNQRTGRLLSLLDTLRLSSAWALVVLDSWRASDLVEQGVVLDLRATGRERVGFDADAMAAGYVLLACLVVSIVATTLGA